MTRIAVPNRPRSGPKGAGARFAWAGWTWLAFAGIVALAFAVRWSVLDQPFRFDEARTYLSYVGDGPGATLTRYDAPNNHVFANLLMGLATRWGGLDRVTVRLPAFLAGVLTVGCLFWIARRWYGLTGAVIGSSVIFGLGHAYQGTSGIVKTGAVAFVMAALYVLSGSLWPPIALHAATDLVN